MGLGVVVWVVGLVEGVPPGVEVLPVWAAATPNARNNADNARKWLRIANLLMSCIGQLVQTDANLVENCA